jgi:hypothetical protein
MTEIFVGGRDFPLTKRARAFDCVSCGLAILSHKGRGCSNRDLEGALPLPSWERIRRPGERCEPLAEVGEGV